MIRKRDLAFLGMLAAVLSPRGEVLAIKDKDNQGRWAKPTVNNLPDKEVPGFLVNLGPTGARGILTEKTFIVKYLFKGSPAEGRLRLDDVITGAFAKPFSSHTFGGSPVPSNGTANACVSHCWQTSACSRTAGASITSP